MEIYEGHKKDSNGHKKWEGVVISSFKANQSDFQPGMTYRPHPAARLVMRLQKNDCVEVRENKKSEKRKYMRVQKMDKSKTTLDLAPLHEANVAKRENKKDFGYERAVSVKALQEREARKIHISPTGRVR